MPSSTTCSRTWSAWASCSTTRAERAISPARTIGLLHPGEMGASVGAAAVAGGARVLWCGAGRSAATRARAERAGLEEAVSLAALCAASDIVVSVCPPASAGQVAGEVASEGFRGCYVDANAVAPATVRVLAERFSGSAARFVDGGLIGPPAWSAGTTRLHLSGDGAPEVAACFAGTHLEANVVAGGIGAASALKMVFAAQTKGHSALLAATLAAAMAYGVEEALVAEWQKTQPALIGRTQAMGVALAGKAWRFEDEMREIAATFEAAGLPGEFHAAAAEVFARLAGFKETEAPELATLLARLREPAD